MSTTMTAQEIGEAWLAYVTDMFMLKNGCVRPDVEEEYKRLDSTGEITKLRELWRNYIDELIDKVIQCPADSRLQLLSATDPRSLAYVQDRIQCGTGLLTALVQKGLKINLEGTASQQEFFRQILLQKQD